MINGAPEGLGEEVSSCCWRNHEYCTHLGKCVKWEQVGMSELRDRSGQSTGDPQAGLQRHGQAVSRLCTVGLSKLVNFRGSCRLGCRMRQTNTAVTGSQDPEDRVRQALWAEAGLGGPADSN